MLKNQRGGAAVEFAIVLPLLAIILLGTIDFALLFYNKQIITNASREGARAAIIEDNQIQGSFISNQEDIVKNYCNGRTISFNVSGTPLQVFAPDIIGEYVTVKVTYDYKHLFSLDFFGSNFGIATTQITGQTTMRSE